MRIPFDLQDWLRDKSQKVETRDGRLVHNIWSIKEPCYTNNKKAEVCALIDGEEDALVFFEGGRYLPTTQDTDSPFDLFIVTPEPELSEFEKGCIRLYQDGRDDGFAGDNLSDENLKECSAKLLALAREQIIKDGYVIEKKAFHDAVEKVAPEVMKEVSDKVDIEEAIRLGYEKGRTDALKDLPRWKKWENGAAGNSYGHPIALVSGAGGIRFVSVLGIIGEKYIMLADLKKLPGFKEDEK